MAVRPCDETNDKVAVAATVTNDAEDEKDVNDDTEAGRREVKRMQSPVKPSDAEVAAHELTHLPFRSWCRHCVRGRGTEAPHRSTQKPDGDLPEFSFDFAFPGNEEAGKTLTVLVVKMRTTRMMMSTVIPTKSTNTFIIKRIMAFLRECGCELGKIIVKSDQEPAVLALLEELTKERAKKGAQETLHENSEKGSSQSNGLVERGVRSAQGMFRVMRSALEERYGIELEVDDAIWPWLVEYASFLLNRQEVGHDGKVAYERLKGKRGTVHGIEFGEGVLWKRRPEGGGLGKLSILWEDGFFLGVKRNNRRIYHRSWR